MKMKCASCLHEVVLNAGDKTPPWCSRCGSDFQQTTVGSVATVAGIQPDGEQSHARAGAIASAVPQNQLVSHRVGERVTAKIFRCSGCRARLTIEVHQPAPPWCPECGADFRIEPPASAPRSTEPGNATAEARVVARPVTTPAVESATPQDPLAGETRPLLQAASGSPSWEAAIAAAAITPSTGRPGPAIDVTDEWATAARLHQSVRPDHDQQRFGRGHDERFARHNLLFGIGMAVWGFVMSGVLPRAGGQDVLNSHGTLMTIIDALQMLACVNGLVLFVSGMGLRQGAVWGGLLARISAAISVAGGAAFLIAWQMLMGSSRGGEVVDAVATATFVRSNLDLLIGLIDGVTLILLLRKTRVFTDRGQISPVPIYQTD